MGAVTIQLCWVSVKGCHIHRLLEEAYEWCMWTDAGSICVICMKFPLQMYINLNHYDSQI
jgi:hypothetical protein